MANRKLSRNEKLTLIFIAENEVYSSKQVAEHVGVSKGYANNILTKLVNMGLVKKRWISIEWNAVLSFVTLDDRVGTANVIYYGVFGSPYVCITDFIKRQLLNLAYRLHPTYIVAPEPVYRSDRYFCTECQTICRYPVWHDTGSGLWCGCAGNDFCGERDTFCKTGEFPDTWIPVSVEIRASILSKGE
jgi:hypothetical protein